MKPVALVLSIIASAFVLGTYVNESHPVCFECGALLTPYDDQQFHVWNFECSRCKLRHTIVTDPDAPGYRGDVLLSR